MSVVSKQDTARIVNDLGDSINDTLHTADAEFMEFFNGILHDFTAILGVLLKDDKDTAVAIISSIADVANEHLKKQRDIYQEALDKISDAVVKLDVVDEVRELRKAPSSKGSRTPTPSDPDILEEILSHIGGGLRIDVDTGEATVIDADEARRLFKQCRKEDEN